MDYQAAIEKAKPLSQVFLDEDIHQLSHALFPGTHCPLFGALLTASYIKGLAVLNIGTSECTFYGKDFSRLRQKGKDSVYSLVTHKNDITFGLEKRIKQAVHDILIHEKPKAILLITTCVVELIGEDIGAIAQLLEEELTLPILWVKTEHFKCNSHMPGIADTLASLVSLMKPATPVKNHVNILGHRFDGFIKSELYQLLHKHKIHINMSIPSACSVDTLNEAGHASLNIVTDFTALPLAKLMQEKLGQPYIVFEKHLSPKRILNAYTQLLKHLAIDAFTDVMSLYQRCCSAIETAAPQLTGKSFIYGNAPVKALECSDFLTELGLNPLWIQLRELYEDDTEYKESLLQNRHDPKISRIANILPMRSVYDAYKPDYYIGHENPMELMKRGIKQITFDKEASGLGFELPLAMLNKLLEPSLKHPYGGRP
jgi:nitrogenase molybdenum-cofactor synthesis protein NifE